MWKYKFESARWHQSIPSEIYISTCFYSGCWWPRGVCKLCLVAFWMFWILLNQTRTLFYAVALLDFLLLEAEFELKGGSRVFCHSPLKLKLKKPCPPPKKEKPIKTNYAPRSSPATPLILRWYLKVMVCVSGSCLPNLDVRKLIMGNLQISESVDWHSQM